MDPADFQPPQAPAAPAPDVTPAAPAQPADPFAGIGVSSFEDLLALPPLEQLTAPEVPGDTTALPGVVPAPVPEPAAGEQSAAPVTPESGQVEGSEPAAADPVAQLASTYGVDNVKAWSEFGQNFMDPAANPIDLYNALAERHPAMVASLFEAAALSPVNQDLFATYALGRDATAAELQAMDAFLASAPPERIHAGLSLLSQLEASGELDDYEIPEYTGQLPTSPQAGGAQPKVDPERAQLEQRLATLEAEKMSKVFDERKSSFESSLETPMDQEFSKVDFTPLDALWKETTGLKFNLSEVIRGELQKEFTRGAYKPQFEAALRHAVSGNDAGLAAFMPTLTVQGQNLARQAAAGLSALTAALAARKQTTVATINSEPRLLGSAAGATGGQSRDEAFNSKVDSGMNPFDALASL